MATVRRAAIASCALARFAEGEGLADERGDLLRGQVIEDVLHQPGPVARAVLQVADGAHPHPPGPCRVVADAGEGPARRPVSREPTAVRDQVERRGADRAAHAVEHDRRARAAGRLERGAGPAWFTVVDGSGRPHAGRLQMRGRGMGLALLQAAMSRARGQELHKLSLRYSRTIPPRSPCTVSPASSRRDAHRAIQASQRRAMGFHPHGPGAIASRHPDHVPCSPEASSPARYSSADHHQGRIDSCGSEKLTAV